MEAQTAYTARAIAYILSLYPAGTSIIVMGHLMGGEIATSLLPMPIISAIHHVDPRTRSRPRALEGARTGVGHREMVWDHQVRWRFARDATAGSATGTRCPRLRTGGSCWAFVEPGKVLSLAPRRSRYL
ncbi:hypothetical protein B0H11DRAFT_2242756 [Mycena galericulata]|nr:hypothetical protein B0H11DRAFT_2242756 [Mycena galericulata]